MKNAELAFVMITLTLLTVPLFSGLAVLAAEVWNAPKAYQDQSGFHYATQPRRGKPAGSALVFGRWVEHNASADSGGLHPAM